MTLLDLPHVKFLGFMVVVWKEDWHSGKACAFSGSNLTWSAHTLLNNFLRTLRYKKVLFS